MFGFQLATPASIATRRPFCPKCGAMMMLARSEPHSPEFRRRTFECPICHHSESALVKLT
jgi:DNA-directed RNA polymerase subunit M/transcription elongation factor TFIIS